MNIKRAKEEIKDTIEAYLLKDEYGAYEIPSIRQRPVLLIGPPGVGKTQIMEQIARECEIGLVAYTITHHTRQSAIGLPYILEKTYGGKPYSVTEYTMSEIVASIYNKIEQTGLTEGLLFIDEINCVSETLAPAMLQFLQCKTFGNHQIPEGWIIAAAGNPPEYNKSVRDFDVVTLDRIKMIHVEADFGVWKEYAYAQSIHPAILAYLNTRPESFCRIETTVDGKMFATPRGWEDLSRLIEVYEKMGKSVDREVIGQYIQLPKVAKDFANYLELYYKYQDDYQIDEILSGTIREKLCNLLKRAPFDEKLSVIGLLLSRLNRGFKEAVTAGERTELLFEELKKLRDGETTEANLAKLRRDFHEEWEKLRAAGLLTRQQDYLRRDVEKILERYEQNLHGWIVNEKPCGEKSCEESLQRISAGRVWEYVKELFGSESAAYDVSISENGAMLENAFNFMEAAFGDSQEMVIFITELNTGYFSVKFLQEYECERYFQYNERLLFKNREDNIKTRIDNLGR